MATETTLWSLGPTVYLPSLLFGIGDGAVVPVIALTARDLGAGVAVAGLVVALMGIGQIIGDVPAGMLATRIGERHTMIVAIGVALVSLAVCLTAQTVWALGLGVAGMGMAASAWGLARHAYLTEVMPYHLRGRALSTLGGCQRVGLFVGPFLSALAMSVMGINGAYWVHVVVTVVAGGVLLVLPDPKLPSGHAKPDTPARTIGTVELVRRHLPVLRTLAVGSLLLSAVRAARPVAIPLWGEYIHLSPTATSIIFGISGGVEALVFYPAGFAMDRWGRKAVVLCATIGLGISYLVLPLTASALMLTFVAMFMGLVNGLGSGINMTIAADVSPADNRPAFLGVWRLLGDIGSGAGPVLISVITAVAALAPAVMAIGGVAGLSAFVMARWLPRHGSPPRPDQQATT